MNNPGTREFDAYAHGAWCWRIWGDVWATQPAMLLEAGILWYLGEA